MKKLLKRIGRIFFDLRQKNESDLRQSVLLVDGSFILANNFALIIRGVKKKFSNAKISVLTFEDKKEFIKDNFPDIEIIVPQDRLKLKNHRLAFQLFFLLRRNFNSIVLSSLDIPSVFISLVFAIGPVLLLNRWMEWFRVRPRTFFDILRGTKSADTSRRRISRGLKEILKSFGRAFVILTQVDDYDVTSRILIEDNGYTEIGHLLTAVRRAKEIFINPDISVVTFSRRKQHFANNFEGIKLYVAEENNARYELSKKMLKAGLSRFNYVILTSLDISPLITSFLFTRGKILLYNRWHQWWGLSIKNVRGLFMGIIVFLAMIPVSVYLLAVTTLILSRTGLRLGVSNLKSFFISKEKENYEAI